MRFVGSAADEIPKDGSLRFVQAHLDALDEASAVANHCGPSASDCARSARRRFGLQPPRPAGLAAVDRFVLLFEHVGVDDGTLHRLELHHLLRQLGVTALQFLQPGLAR